MRGLTFLLSSPFLWLGITAIVYHIRCNNNHWCLSDYLISFIAVLLLAKTGGLAFDLNVSNSIVERTSLKYMLPWFCYSHYPVCNVMRLGMEIDGYV